MVGSPSVATTQPEAKITKRIIDYLKGRGHARKVHQNAYGAGEPDIDACINGRAVKIEVKVKGNTPTPKQYAALRRWESSGALCGWVTSIEETIALLEHLPEAEWSNPQLIRSGPDA